MSNKDNNLNYLLNKGAVFSAVKYIVVFLGFFRTLITADILTKNELGLLAFVLLILEYMTIIAPMGSVYALNKDITNKQSRSNRISKKNSEVKSTYETTVLIILFGVGVSSASVLLLSHFDVLFSSFSKEILFQVVIVLILSIYRGFAVVHNRIWSQYARISLSEFFYATIYLCGIYLFIDEAENFLQIYLNIITVSLIVSIYFSKFRIPLSFSNTTKETIKKALSIGVVLMAYNFFETFLWGVDRVYIAIYLSPSELANFHIAHTFSRGAFMAYMAVTFLFTSIFMRKCFLIDDSKREKDRVFSIVKGLSSSSESILALVMLMTVLLVPPIVDMYMEKYSNISNILILIVIGLSLKGLCFYPATYMITNHMQQLLIKYSFVFSVIAAILYFIFSDYMSSAIHYLSLSTLVFLFYFIYIYAKLNDSVIFLRSLYDALFLFRKFLILTIIAITSVNFSTNYEIIFSIAIVLLYGSNILAIFIAMINSIRYRDNSHILSFFFKRGG